VGGWVGVEGVVGVGLACCWRPLWGLRLPQRVACLRQRPRAA